MVTLLTMLSLFLGTAFITQFVFLTVAYDKISSLKSKNLEYENKIQSLKLQLEREKTRNEVLEEQFEFRGRSKKRFSRRDDNDDSDDDSVTQTSVVV